MIREGDRGGNPHERRIPGIAAEDEIEHVKDSWLQVSSVSWWFSKSWM